DEMGARLGVTDDWIAQRTGIRRRRVTAPGVSTGDLAAEAGRRALEAASDLTRWARGWESLMTGSRSAPESGGAASRPPASALAISPPKPGAGRWRRPPI